jgi:methanogenic corrinoid protein MtbC1
MYGIKIATLRSGLTPHVIRMWEKRYEAVETHRSTTNRRLYTDQSIQRLVHLAELTRNGHSIGNIANLPDKELSELHRTLSPSAPKVAERANTDQKYVQVIKATLTAISNFDQCSLEKIFDEVVKKYGYSALIEKVLIPLIHNVGESWHDGDVTTAEEHAATSFIKDYLCVSARSFTSASNAPKLLITTPQGQLHELGAAIAASQARKLGWQVIYLGTSLPPDEIAGAAEKIGARAVILSIIYPLDDPQINGHLRKLRSQLDCNITIIVGGAQSKLYTPTLEELDIVQLKTLSDLSPELCKLRN